MLRIVLFFLLIVSVPILIWNNWQPLLNEQIEILWSAGYVLLAVIIYCFIVGEITNNNSQIDKLWSIVPIVYAWHMTYLGEFNHRMMLMTILVTIWGARLTFNFARRGGYSWRFWDGEEDYRWAILRKKPGLNKRFVWMLFNLFFISGFQNVLIFLTVVPILTSLNGSSYPLQWYDYVLAVGFIVLIIIEFVSDQQQWNFQKEKYRRISNHLALEKYEDGFIQTGLWSIVRHPNYTAEQGVWIVIYLFSVSATGQWFNWSAIGFLLLLILFKGSSDFLENLAVEKYPKYKEYQKRVGKYLPWLF